jgi:hypothetical protein
MAARGFVGQALGGFSARSGAETKQRLLAIEGAKTGHAPGPFDED